MAIVIFQHDVQQAPGRLGLTLRDHAQRLRIIRLDRGEKVPGDFDGVDGVISLGGPQNVGESHPWMEPQLAYLREAHKRQLPVVGVCLGHQLLAAALGGTVAPMERPEIGMIAVSQHPIANTDIVLAGVPWKSWQFQHHAYEVKELPAGATLLQSSTACKVQSFRAGLRTFGFQYHFECDMPMIAEFCSSSPEQLAKAGVTLEDVAQQAELHYEQFARVADRLSVNIATYLFGVGSRKFAAA